MKLESDKGELESVVAEARARLEAGMPPTDDAEQEWSVLCPCVLPDVLSDVLSDLLSEPCVVLQCCV